MDQADKTIIIYQNTVSESQTHCSIIVGLYSVAFIIEVPTKSLQCGHEEDLDITRAFFQVLQYENFQCFICQQEYFIIIFCCCKQLR